MVPALLIVLQAAAAPAPGAAAPLAEIDFDLRRLARGDASRFSIAPRCRRDGDAILVCARRPTGGEYDTEAWEPVFAQRPIRAEARLFGDATGAVELEQVELLRGEISNRIMVRLRLPF